MIIYHPNLEIGNISFEFNFEMSTNISKGNQDITMIHVLKEGNFTFGLVISGWMKR